VLRGVARLVGLSVYGLFAFVVSLLGYALGLGLVIVALVKPFQPHNVGLWRLPDAHDPWSFTLGATSSPHGQELLGWWIIPLGLLVGPLIAWLTWRFGIFSLRLMGRRARRPGA